MIFKQELSPQNGRYTPVLCFHLGFGINEIKTLTFDQKLTS